jgi:hypothetical protein
MIRSIATLWPTELPGASQNMFLEIYDLALMAISLFYHILIKIVFNKTIVKKIK